MKIGYDARRFFRNSSGLGNYSRDLIRILASFQPENEYILFDIKPSERGRDILKLPCVEWKSIGKGKFSRQFKMGKAAQASECEIFHGLSGELPLSWDKRPIRKVVTIHDLIFYHYPQYYSFFDRKIHFWKFKKAAEKADLIISISEQTKRDIVQILGVPAEKVRVVYQGCHPAFKEVISTDVLVAVREKFALPDRFVLNVGTIEPRKNLHSVISALDGLAIPLVVVGKKKPRYFKTIQALLKKVKVDVFFLDNVDVTELSALYHLADIFVYPSLYEGFGIPVIEALFSSTAVITSNVSSLPEAGGQGALYVSPQDISDIRAKIIYLWNSASERRRRAAIGELYAARFTDEEVSRALFAVYQEVASK